jgi:hypothetical protein
VELTGLRPGEAVPFRIEAWDGGGMRLSKGLTFGEDNIFKLHGEGGTNGRLELDVSRLFAEGWPHWLRIRLAHPGYMPVLTELRVRPKAEGEEEAGGGFGVAAEDEEEEEERAPATGHYTLDVEVAPAHTLAGTIRTADGSDPGRKVHVAAYPLGPDGPEARAIHDPAAVAMGAFAVQVPAHADYYVVAVVNGYLPVGVDLRGAHASARVPDLVLERGESISGTVTAPTGDPIPNASVRAAIPAPEGARRHVALPFGNGVLHLSDGGLSVSAAWGRADTEGRFTVHGLRPGSYALHITAVMSRQLTRTISNVRGTARTHTSCWFGTAWGRTASGRCCRAAGSGAPWPPPGVLRGRRRAPTLSRSAARVSEPCSAIWVS